MPASPSTGAPQSPCLWLFDDHSGCWLHFSRPQRIVVAHQLQQVPAVLAEVRRATENGWHAAGFLAYEAAPAFDPAFITHTGNGFPLAWFGIFDAPQQLAELPGSHGRFSLSPWQMTLSRNEYLHAIASIKKHIAAGDTYQVNFTMRLRSRFSGDAFALFQSLHAGQQSRFSAFADTGDFYICSASPELFFRQQGEIVRTRPMKGTAARGLTSAQDHERRLWLEQSEKNRAENLMIVDMLRNDLGRLARIGSVRVPSLFALERYPTVWQMTSEVSANIPLHPAETLAGLFPCASITGAPKASTMSIIAGLENSPRRIYTGSIGFISPNRTAQFNVAIRTVLIDKQQGVAEYGTGSGVVQDSDPQEEWQECRLKAEVLLRKWPSFRLLETLLWQPDEGFAYLHEHLDRLSQSAQYFGFSCCQQEIEQALNLAAETFPPEARKVRLLVSQTGAWHIENHPLPGAGEGPLRLALAAQPVQIDSVFLYHKTTWRTLYEQTRLGCPQANDVILWNEKGQLTETTIANLALRIDGRWLTPPVSCGLLAGIERARLLAEGKIHEAPLPVEALQRNEGIAVFNSVRGWQQAVMLQEADSLEKLRISS